MYHISKDIRSQKSASLLAEGLLKCSRQKPFDQITVADLQKASTVSRATFYRLFDNITDLLQYICNSYFDELAMNHSVFIQRGAKAFGVDFLSKLTKNREIIRLLTSSGNLDLIREAHIKYFSSIREAIGITEQDDKTSDYIIELLSGALPLVLKVWVDHGEKESPDELYELMHHSLSFIGKLFDDKNETRI